MNRRALRVGGQVLRKERPLRGYTRLPTTYDDLPLESRRFSKVSALGERHGVSFVSLKAMGRLNKDFVIASGRFHARNNDLATHLIMRPVRGWVFLAHSGA